MRSRQQLHQVQHLLDAGKTDAEIATLTGVPRRTVCDWRRGHNLIRIRARRPGDYDCAEVHDFSNLPAGTYVYLLGLYLGDGCISRAERGVYRLRITLDSQYPGIIAQCQRALESTFPDKRAHVGRRPHSRCVDVSMWSKHWPCLIPQHGPGPKHQRAIRLTTWQMSLVDKHRESFLRGLIHSDGCRIVATERSRGHTRQAPRYTFSNRPEDIKRLFCESCDALGIKWTRPSAIQIAVYRKASVATLDQFVGPKA